MIPAGGCRASLCYDKPIGCDKQRGAFVVGAVSTLRMRSQVRIAMRRAAVLLDRLQTKSSRVEPKIGPSLTRPDQRPTVSSQGPIS